MLVKTINVVVKDPTNLPDGERYKLRKEIWASIGLEPIECGRRDRGVYYVNSYSNGRSEFEFNVVPGKEYNLNHPSILEAFHWDYARHVNVTCDRLFVAKDNEIVK